MKESRNQNKTIPYPVEPNVCEFSEKVSYVLLGRICQLDDCACFNWNYPSVFASCPTRRRLLNDLHEKELLEQQ
ncbi:MAG: hypothetical protein ABSF44_03680 [Candidatus Bathyarchaeia archaeon]